MLTEIRSRRRFDWTTYLLNSGSPVMNRKGNVIGLVNMKLSDKEAIKSMGSISQNVNFAINERTLKGFLDQQKVDYDTARPWNFMNNSLVDIAESSRKAIVLIECWE